MSKQFKYLALDKEELAVSFNGYTESNSLDYKKLDMLGKKGWDLVCSTETQMVFKKEVN